MYESPISLKIEKFVDNVQRATQNQILYKVREIVDVDREELIRALRYDRGQYKKGYEDGRRDAVRHAYNKCEEYPSLFECSSCGEECNDTTPWDHPGIKYCPRCGAKIIGEMEYKMLYHSAFPDVKESGRRDER